MTTEKLFSQLMQVSGRAGRSNIKGEVLIQTAFPNNPVFEGLKNITMKFLLKLFFRKESKWAFPLLVLLLF